MNNWIGITGKMSAGKTTIAKQLIKEENNLIYINVDDFRRKKLEDELYIKELKQQIPPLRKYQVVTSIDLNKYIYKYKKYMKRYKKILYKHLLLYLSNLKNKQILVEWALLINDHLDKYFRKIIYVDIKDEIAINRLKKNSDLKISEIKKRLKEQKIQRFKKEVKEKILIIDGERTVNMEQIKEFIKPMKCKFTLSNNKKKAIWEVTHQCNYQCSYCMFSCNYKKEERELTTEECYHVIDELVKEGFTQLKITGGEPFLRKDILEILTYASKRLETDISTNASMITENIVKKLNNLSLKMIHVSLDGTKEQHESVRGKNTYERTLKGLEALKKSKNKIRIGTVIHANNENDLEGVIKNSIDLKASEIIFSIMDLMHSEDKTLGKKEPNHILIKKIKVLKEKYKDSIIVNLNFDDQPSYVTKCPGGNHFIFIDNLGRVSPCTWIYEKNKDFISKQSLKNETLQNVLSEENLKQFICGKKAGICYGEI